MTARTVTTHQPRERAVPCQRCRRDTWNFDAVCDVCQAPSPVYPAGFRPRPRRITPTRLLAAWIVAGCTAIGVIIGVYGGAPANTVPATTVFSTVAGYSYSCVGEVPQVCTATVQTPIR